MRPGHMGIEVQCTRVRLGCVGIISLAGPVRARASGTRGNVIVYYMLSRCLTDCVQHLSEMSGNSLTGSESCRSARACVQDAWE